MIIYAIIVTNISNTFFLSIHDAILPSHTSRGYGVITARALCSPLLNRENDGSVPVIRRYYLTGLAVSGNGSVLVAGTRRPLRKKGLRGKGRQREKEGRGRGEREREK